MKMSGRIKTAINYGASLTMAGALCASCATALPSAQLEDARSAYQAASRGVTAELNPAGLHEAEQALAQAEQAYQADPGSSKAQDLAYIAHRRVQIADADADAEQAKIEEKQAKAGYTEQLRSTAENASAQLDATQGALASERQARLAAEKRAEDALEALEDVANVQQDANGLKITLSGAVIFKTNSSDLRDVAKTRLTEVADAIEGYPDKSIVVEGHTDARGPEGYNQQLSQRRAETVRSYLISQGVASDRIRAVGKGESEPLAENDTAEGRANNRRVEIIVGEPGS
ncbi:MAG: OmpA family protein [Polyangiales bacterium]